MASDLVDQAIAAIDGVNAEDPASIDGRPRALVHADRVTAWLLRLDPSADVAQRLAARAHHLRRWAVPRDTYPAGRSGYLRWRTDQKKRHADEVGVLLAGVGADAALIERVQTIVAKRGLGRDPQVQTHEDALCLAFLEGQFDDVADQLGDDHTIEVLRKTAVKMSPEALALAGTIDVSERGARLLAAALA